MSGLVFRDAGGWLSGPCLDEPLPDPLAAYRERWEIQVRPGGLDVLSAVRRWRTETRVIVGRTAEELAAKLHTAEVPEP